MSDSDNFPWTEEIMAMPQSNRQPWDKPLDSLERVSEGLAYLNMPPPNHQALLALATSPEKSKFKEVLGRILQDQTGNADENDKRYLAGLAHCISSVMFTALEHIGYTNVPPEVMVHIGKTNGLSFRAATNAAINKNHKDHANSHAFIENAFKEACEATSAIMSMPQRPRLVHDAIKQNAAEIKKGGSMESRPAPQPQLLAEAANQPSSLDNELEPGLSDQQDKDFQSTHVYGGKAAICFNAAKSRNNDNYTIIVDGALSVGERKYNWGDAVHIQLGHKELPVLFAVLMGWERSVKFDAHGQSNDKVFEIEYQPKNAHFFAKVMAKGKEPRAVPMKIMDAHPVMQLVLDQIVKQSPPSLQKNPELVVSLMKQMFMTMRKQPE